MENSKFEYKVLKIHYSDSDYTEKERNKVAIYGWELVAIRKDDYFIFKRKLKSDYEIQNGGQ